MYYARLQENYGWTMFEIDEHEIKYLTKQLAALQIANAEPEQTVFIDDII